MAATDVKLIDSRCTRCDLDGMREYENDYQVKTDNRLDGPITARDAGGVPSPGDYWQDWTDFDVAKEWVRIPAPDRTAYRIVARY